MARWEALPLLVGTRDELDAVLRAKKEAMDAAVAEAFAAALGDAKNAVVDADGALALPVEFVMPVGVQLNEVLEIVQRVAIQWDDKHRWILEPCDCSWRPEEVDVRGENADGVANNVRAAQRYRLVLRQMHERSR